MNEKPQKATSPNLRTGEVAFVDGIFVVWDGDFYEPLKHCGGVQLNINRQFTHYSMDLLPGTATFEAIDTAWKLHTLSKFPVRFTFNGVKVTIGDY